MTSPLLIDLSNESATSEIVPASTLDVILAMYQTAGTRYLQSATYLGQGAFEARFRIDGYHHFDPGESTEVHLAEVALTNAYNQITYVAMAHLLDTNRLVSVPTMDPAAFAKIQMEIAFITESHYRYPGGIDLGATPEFDGHFSFTSLSLLNRPTDLSLRTENTLTLGDNKPDGNRRVYFFFPLEK